MKSPSPVPSVLHPAPCAGLDVIGLGYCVWDYLGIIAEIPEFDAPTATLDDFAISGGGPVSTALVTLGRLGVRTGFLGTVGDDEAGMNIRRAFEEEGVDISRLRVRAGMRSQVCICLVQAQTGKRMLLRYPGTSGEVRLEPPDQDYITAARFLHLDGYHIHAAITAAQWMREAGATVVLDANRPRPHLDELLPWVDILITNADFPTAYTGEPTLEQATRQLLAKSGAKLVVSTLGERGCLWITAEGRSYVPGFEVPVVDTTGAGDAFHGAFIYGLLQDWPIERIATFANAVAAMNCTALGGRTGLPRLHEVEEFLKTRTKPGFLNPKPGFCFWKPGF
jgi:sugar/nucleoside kinase (ribokinase family)